MPKTTITARIRGETIARDQILRWENRRITAAARKIDVRVRDGDDVATRREALLQEKLRLGADEITVRLRNDTQLAAVVARAGAGLSKRRRLCVIDLDISNAAAQPFVEAFESWSESSDEEAMLRACPDHYVIRTRDDGRQEVLETTGGSPLPSLFFIDYEDVSSLVTPPDPTFAHQIAGVARTSNGTAIGGVRHQFRDTADGFHARLTVEFPLPTMGRMVSGHRWHLACEFSNWAEAALG